MTEIPETNQNIKITVLGKSISLKIIITKPSDREVTVMACKALIITFVPMNFKTDLYNPNWRNKGIAIDGIIKNIQKLADIISDQKLPKRKVNENQIENTRMIISDTIMSICFFDLFKFLRSFLIKESGDYL